MNKQHTEAEVARAELRRLGLTDVDVTDHDGSAWLRTRRDHIAAITAEPLRGEVLRAVRAAGFQRVAIDLDGD